MKDILDLYAAGEIDFAEAKNRLHRSLYNQAEDFQLDLHRHERLGFPEIILAESKTVEQVVQISTRILDHASFVIVSNIRPEQEEALRKNFAHKQVRLAGRIMAIGEKKEPAELGIAGIITAGTSDVPYAQESALVLECLGVSVIDVHDAGVAGIHRPFMSLGDVAVAQVLIIFAGMEGALPTLIASLTDKPIIAVPTPIGYGIGGKGIGAMISMLQTCAPGVLVVNIGNTIGAAAGAMRILKALKRCA